MVLSTRRRLVCWSSNISSKYKKNCRERENHSESNVSVVSNIDSDVAKASTTTDNGELQYGDRLLDDLMNTFCDRLQNACPRKIDGCLAIQFVLVEPQSLKSLISIDKPTHQIIFDPDRVHYVVVDYDPKAKLVVLYDSLVEKESNIASLLTEPIRKQVSALFSHIFTNKAIYVAISRSYDRQTDTWSCGYRSIACMVDLARQRNPCDSQYCMKSIFSFFQKVINENKTDWEEFETAYLGESRQNNENTVTLVRLYPDLVFEEISCRTTVSSHEPSVSELGIQKFNLRSPITTVSTVEVDTKSEDSVKYVTLRNSEFI